MLWVSLETAILFFSSNNNKLHFIRLYTAKDKTIVGEKEYTLVFFFFWKLQPDTLDMYSMDYLKFIVSTQKEEFISIQGLNLVVFLYNS